MANDNFMKILARGKKKNGMVITDLQVGDMHYDKMKVAKKTIAGVINK